MTAAELQAQLDKAFPAAVNVRIVDAGGDEDRDIDFMAPCLIVLDNPLRVWFGSAGNNGKTFEAADVTKVQDVPFPRYEAKSETSTFWFWPRPVPAEQRDQLTKMKAGVRETARTYLGADV